MAKKSKSRTDATQSAASDAGPSRFKTSVLLAAMLFAPAAFLVLRGNLSINEALIRFGCALLFAMVGTAVVISSMPAPDGAGAASPSGAGDGSAADQTPSAVPAVPAPMGAVPVTQPAG